MGHSINPLLALVASGHAFNKHVLGEDGGDREFVQGRYGPSLKVSSVQDAARMLQDIVRDSKNTHVAYNPDDGYLSFVNTARNVQLAFNGYVSGGDCGTFFRPVNPQNEESVALDSLVRKTNNYTSSDNNYTITGDPKRIEQIVNDFCKKIRVSKAAVKRAGTEEVREITQMLNDREEHLEKHAAALEAKNQEDRLATRFIRCAKRAKPEDYEVELTGEGGCTVTYIDKKNEIQEVSFGERNTKRVARELGITL